MVFSILKHHIFILPCQLLHVNLFFKRFFSVKGCPKHGRKGKTFQNVLMFLRVFLLLAKWMLRLFSVFDLF